MPTLPLTPPANATTTTFQIGTYNSVTDTFSVVYDLNDYTHTWLHNAKTQLQPGKKVAVRSSNMRVNGERVVRWRRPNAHITVECYIRDVTPQAVVNRVHSLIAAVENPPYVIRFAEPGATSYSYFDVVLCDPSPPYDPQTLNANAIMHISLDFEVRPAYRGDRITLQNLAVNPGFEAPSGPGVLAFSDSFANANAYTLGGGSAPTVAGNVMSVPSGTFLTFGSPAWGAIQNWQIRWRWVTGLQATFYLHHPDTNDYLQVFCNGAEFELDQIIGGVNHQLQLVNAALTNGNWYWFKMTQFPSVPGDPPYISVSLYNDSAGAIGTQVATSIGVATFDAVTALSGTPIILASGATLQVGGAFAGVQSLSLFGPGGWTCNGAQGSATGVTAGAWETAQGNPAYTPPTNNLYSGGPVTSFGAARLDLPPAGTVDAAWRLFSGGTPAGSSAVPVAAAGNTLAWSVAARQTTLAGTTVCEVYLDEYDASGNFLRNGGFTSVKSTTWATFSGTYTTGASCAYVSLNLHVFDTNAGASANATVWFDNVQCWNVTTTGQSTMPYCELRFSQSPAQLVVSGIQGDAPARAWVGLGTYVSALNTGSQLQMYLGRRNQVSANAQLVGPSAGWYGTVITPQAVAVLDSGSYGGFYAQVTMTAWNPRAFNQRPQDALGTYHLLTRFLTQQALGNLGNVQVRVAIQERTLSWYGNANLSDQLWIYYNQFITNPISTSSAWTLVDAGQVPLVPHLRAALADLSQNYLTPRPSWVDNTGGGSVCQSGWQMLLPVDGSLIGALLYNPSNAPFNVTNQYVWQYADGLGLAIGGQAAWTYSLETTALPNAGRGAGGPGTTSTGALSVNPNADPYLTLDPTEPMVLGGTAVNQFAALITDQNATVLPVYAEIQYSPMYYFPR